MNEVFLDSDGICRACKIQKRYLRHYVEKYGLPAFQTDPPTGTYRARPASLRKWAREFEKRFVDGSG